MASSLVKCFCGKWSPYAVLRVAAQVNRHQCYLHTHRVLYGVTRLVMPSLSPTMEVGTIIEWHKKEGDPVSAGDALCQIKTDKADIAFEMEEDGILAKILIPGGTEDIKIGSLIGLMVDEGEDWKNVEIPADIAVAAPSATQPEQAVHQKTASSSDHVWPSVRKLLDEYHIDPDRLRPSGPQGQLLKGDVLKHIENENLIKAKFPATVSAPPSPLSLPSTQAAAPVFSLGQEAYVDIPHTNMRKTIAKRLTESKATIPHAYMTMDCAMSNVISVRKQLIAGDVKVSVNDFIIKAAAIALQRVPQVNSIWKGDGSRMSSSVDVSVAVATDNGLITPIIMNAAYQGLQDISNSMKDLASRAREGKLQLHEFQGGSFTISNLGMFGITEFSAVINPPQTAIMAVGGSRVVLSTDLKPQPVMTVQLSYDARAIDETEASDFLETFRDIMENPRVLLAGDKAKRKAEMC